MPFQRYLYNLATDKYKGFIPGLIKFLLFILSCVYGLLVRVLIFLYHLKAYRLSCKVISVGNLTLGGTGKTSLVEYIARYLKKEGHKVAILSRGYKRKFAQYPIRPPSPRLRGTVRRSFNEGGRDTQYEIMGDEPYMLSRNLGDIPVIVDANRIRGARSAIRDYGVGIVILDDGFQQWKIRKDLEIVTIDATNPFGNRYLIPRGILREPLFSLRRADVCVLTKTNLMPNVTNQVASLRHPEVTLQRDTVFGNPDAECSKSGSLTSASRSSTSKRHSIRDIQDLKDFLISINPKIVIFESMHRPVGFYQVDNPDEWLKPEILKNKTVALFSGIADPDSFENLILSLGINIGLSFRFRDHYNYSQQDLDKIVQASKEKGVNAIITTEKDAARLSAIPAVGGSAFGGSYQLSAIQILILRINLEIKNEQGFHDRLLRLYSF